MHSDITGETGTANSGANKFADGGLPRDLDALLVRADSAAALIAAGYPTSAATLATLATRGGGPPYQLYGRRPLYRLRDLLVWAEGKLSPPRHSSSEGLPAGRPSATEATPARSSPGVVSLHPSGVSSPTELLSRRNSPLSGP